ncbi:MAG: hypothetical protein Q8N18_24945 [Opitutaceae bacterium]|nr:hypothetical protein [Opitutaceae bacterium]
MKITLRPAIYGRLNFSRQEFGRLQAAWAGIESPTRLTSLPSASAARSTNPKPSRLSRRWCDAA